MKNFNNIYEKVYKECHDPLENLRKKSRNEAIILIITFMAIGLLLAKIVKHELFIILAILFIIIFLFRSKKNNMYNSLFKGKVIKAFVKEYSQDLDYKPLMGIPQITYIKGKFEPYQKYYSEDLIVGLLEGGYPIKMAEVKTEVEHTDSDGDTTTYTVFHGLFAEVQLDKMINVSMKIRRNNISLFSKKYKIEMDSGEFEKKFNVYSTNKIIAMQLLTSDIMQLLMNFVEQNKVIPEITLEGSKFYIRFSTGDVFEAKLMKKALDYGTLKKYYDIINFTLTLTEKFLKNVHETEV